MTWVQDDGAGGIVAAGSVTDEELNAYIDGELSADRRCEVERLIASDDAALARRSAAPRTRACVPAFTHHNLETTP